MLPAPHESGFFVQVRPDVRLHVVTSGEGSPIIFLHGYPEFWWSWHYQLRFLSQYGFRTIAPDFRGVNYSDKPAKGYDPETLADDIIGMMDAMGYERADFVGHDYGGFVAYTLAMLYPDRVHRIATINTLHPAKWPGRSRSSKRMMRVIAILADLLNRIFQVGMAAGNEAIGVGRAMLWMAYNPKTFPHHVRKAHSRAYARGALTATRYVPHTARWLYEGQPLEQHIPHPVLVIWSENDVFAPVTITNDLHESLPQAQIVTIPGAGHWTHQEQPSAVNEALLNFFVTNP